MTDGTDRPTVWRGSIYDHNQEEHMDEILFTNSDSAFVHVARVLDELGIEAHMDDFEQVSERLWKARYGTYEGQIVRPKVFDSADEPRSVDTGTERSEQSEGGGQRED